MASLTEQLKQQALDEGFDLVGVAEAGPCQGSSALERWLESDFHGEMNYMADTAAIRADPQNLLPGCRSVVAVAMSYRSSQPSSQASREADRGWVSRYAWGRDYHRVMKKRLVRLGRWLSENSPDCGWRACVDTAPILERAWAAAAGLGWIGKNTSLINRRLGSELFLGILLTTVELVADGPTTTHCGRCTACLDACPTTAFQEPGVLDARRCIAYLSVEHRGEIDPDLAARFGSNVAGCDICQEVCPWTTRAPGDVHPEFQPAPHRYRPPLSDLESLDEEGYREWRRGSPLNRIPFAQFRRNVKIARTNACGRIIT